MKAQSLRDKIHFATRDDFDEKADASNALQALFIAKAQQAGSEVHHYAGKKEALSFIIELLKEETRAQTHAPMIVCAPCSFLTEDRKKELREKVPGLTFDVTKETAGRAKVGISQMDQAIADTGTLMQDVKAIEQRLVSMLPDMHVVLMSTRNILPDLAAALSRMSPVDAPYIAFITGPSRTADIERVLTIGVHGPKRLVIVLVDQLET